MGGLRAVGLWRGGVGEQPEAERAKGSPMPNRSDSADEIWPIDTGESPKRKESPQVETEGSAVAIGIDAAVVADHHVMVRQRETRGPGTVLEEFHVAPTLVGMERLSKKLSAYPGALAVAEPTSMTWLPLALAPRGRRRLRPQQASVESHAARGRGGGTPEAIVMCCPLLHGEQGATDSIRGLSPSRSFGAETEGGGRTG